MIVIYFEGSKLLCREEKSDQKISTHMINKEYMLPYPAEGFVVTHIKYAIFCIKSLKIQKCIHGKLTTFPINILKRIAALHIKVDVLDSCHE